MPKLYECFKLPRFGALINPNLINRPVNMIPFSGYNLRHSCPASNSDFNVHVCGSALVSSESHSVLEEKDIKGRGTEEIDCTLKIRPHPPKVEKETSCKEL